jgi:hypothetical protein
VNRDSNKELEQKIMGPDHAKSADFYKVETKTVQRPVGLTMNIARKAEEVQVLNKAFLTSFKETESRMMQELVTSFVGNSELNDLLIVIREGVAYIYKKFPITLLVKVKESIKQYHTVFKNQILDIEGVQFKDSYFELDVKDNDLFLWLHRSNFNFGLYFDFTGELKVSELSSALGACYRKLEYYATYSYFQDSKNVDTLFDKGWFPFIQLIGSDLDVMISTPSYEIDKFGELISETFNKNRIEKMTSYWWNNRIFSQKKDLIEAGISAYMENSVRGNISCIKILLSEIEGILHFSYLGENGKRGKTEDLKTYLTEKATRKFSNTDSLGFPTLFHDYLNRVIFKDFDLTTGHLSLSRHTANHGVADAQEYTRMRSLQCLLTLDQIYFYLGNNKKNNPIYESI